MARKVNTRNRIKPPARDANFKVRQTRLEQDEAEGKAIRFIGRPVPRRRPEPTPELEGS